jgi:hypothetical protein
MKKFLFSIFLMSFIGLNVFSQTNYEDNKYHYWTDAHGTYFFEFKQGVFTLYEYSNTTIESVPLPGYESQFGDINAKVISGKYNKYNKNGFEYISVNDIEYLILCNDDKYCVLYENNTNKRSYYGLNEKYVNTRSGGHALFTPEFKKFIRFGSSLQGETRDGILYQPPFGRLGYGSIWAYSGINNWIELDCMVNVNRIYFINGMIYPSNMNFYYYNNQVKTIRVFYNNREEIFILKDTPSPQIITLKESTKNDQNLKIEIIDVYKGTRYNDTVISFIGYLRDYME